ncbi:MAG TPA: WD40 repeat domain-containing protein [Cyclobacteriaceae bacterium]|nr:WD40 repeat domain-containing protein [Cyclobacteriaceae bacterium]
MAGIQIQKLHSLTGHRNSVYTLEPGPQPAIFFSGSGDGMVVRWDLDNAEMGERIAQLPNSIYALRYLPDQDILVVGHNYEGIHLLDWKNKKEVASLKLSSAAIFDMQIFEKYILVASGDGTVTVVDMENLTVIKRLTESKKNARTIAVNPVSGEMAVGYSDHHIRVFGLTDFALKHEFLAHSNSVFTLAYTPDYQFLLSGSRDARLKSWDTKGNYSLHQEVVAHLFAINHVAFSPDGKHFVTCSMDKSVKVWRTLDLTLLKVIDKARHAGHGTSVNKLLWSPYHNQLLSAGDDRTISVWDVIF